MCLAPQSSASSVGSAPERVRAPAGGYRRLFRIFGPAHLHPAEAAGQAIPNEPARLMEPANGLRIGAGGLVIKEKRVGKLCGTKPTSKLAGPMSVPG